MCRVCSERSKDRIETTESASVGLEAAIDRAIKALHRIQQQLNLQFYWTTRNAHGSYLDGHAWPDGDG